MKIWFTEIGEPLPLEPDARLLRYGLLTRYLAQRGHDVTWWTSNFSHSQKRFVTPGDLETQWEGVKLRVLAGPGYGRNVSLARFRHQREFSRRFAEEAPKAPRPDLIVSPIPTLETAREAVRLGKAWGVPVVTDIRDEWPDEFVRLVPGTLRWAAKAALFRQYQSARYVCRNATGIVGISRRQLGYGLRMAGRELGPRDGMMPLGYLRQSLPNEKLEIARHWWKHQGLKPNTFKVAFVGTIGRFFDLETVIRAARTLRKEFPIQFVLGGSGDHLSRFQSLAKDCPEILFPGWLDAPKIASLLELSHLALAPYRREGEVFSLPNKPFEYLAAGLPILSTIQGELKDLLAEHRCGVTYQADNVQELEQQVRWFHQHPEERSEYSVRAKALAAQFATDQIHERFGALLEKVGTPVPHIN